MAENNKNSNINNEVATNETVTENTADDALNSFLGRESDNTADDKKSDKPKKLSKNALWIIIATVAVLVIVGIVILLKTAPAPDSTKSEYDPGTDISLTVDESGEHQAQPVLNEKGELDNNSYGTLLEYAPSQITQIDVENQSGSFTVLAKTNVTVNEETGEENRDATVYTLVGFENIALQTGTPDAIANSVSAVEFTSVADVSGKNVSDYGFDKPRATVKTTFSDDTTSTIIVGDDAPSQLGTYIMFGNSDTVYVADTASIECFLFSVTDLVTLSINDSASTTENSEFESLSLSGSAYGTTIEIKPNEDEAIDSTYTMISPKKMYISEIEAANISGAIRGLYAEKAVCVNPSSGQLSEYGLSSPYAQLTAVYPDTTVNLKLSKPVDDKVYIIGDSNIIYTIGTAAVPWVYTTLDKLTPDTVINPNFNSLTKIEVTDTSGTYVIDVTTTTDTATNTDGTQEQVSSTKAMYNGTKLDDDNFYIFYQNICAMQNAGATDATVSGSPVLTIKLSYSTGRATDTVAVYPTGNTKYIATLNGQVQSLVYKSYCTKFEQCVQDLIMGKTVGSF